MAYAKPFSTSTLQGISNGIKNTSGRGLLTSAIELWSCGSPRGLQVPTFGSVNLILTLASKWGCDKIFVWQNILKNPNGAMCHILRLPYVNILVCIIVTNVIIGIHPWIHVSNCRTCILQKVNFIRCFTTNVICNLSFAIRLIFSCKCHLPLKFSHKQYFSY
jgi:hypothetical protein